MTSSRANAYKLYKETAEITYEKVKKVIPLAVGQWEWLIFGWICFIPIFWFVIAILLCIWVYRDAESRGMSGALWLIIVLIGSIVGLIVYLIVRKDRQEPSART